MYVDTQYIAEVLRHLLPKPNLQGESGWWPLQMKAEKVILDRCSKEWQISRCHSYYYVLCLSDSRQIV